MLRSARDDKLIRILRRELHRVANHITPQTTRRGDEHGVVLAYFDTFERYDIRIR